MITFKSEGYVLGNCWGGGKCGYKAYSYTADTLEELREKIITNLKSGALDSGMGYESLIGAIITITEKEVRVIDGKHFVSEEELEPEVFSVRDLTDEEVDFLYEMSV